jgi:hypothetical protein
MKDFQDGRYDGQNIVFEGIDYSPWHRGGRQTQRRSGIGARVWSCPQSLPMLEAVVLLGMIVLAIGVH